MIEAIIQVVIFATSIIAIALTQLKDSKLTRFACFIGLAGEPFWFYTTYTHDQWGLFALCFFYTGAWMMGVYNYWIK